ncbi:ABC transporter permease [Ketogulonicigenium vulgare]|uniref:ABC transporter permease n=1 Tax=Ketogulonicigenium vulgare TaxID=92945 RepID=UPI0001E670FB|nr:ABC transporter permease [Ketogulonicigenium vulgare]ADO43722.1 Binding-protein-dependent transport systems inner membrane component [Ketogulonicigenium vulgare Y25]ALJ82086.1 ABC transporter permease [Ketogulonicigenium vulgare]ANW34710.1 ABC transporter permease [Ketogulonicigenium vulgare]AOZ55754.1 Binding-protein-dependent transporters inner membrane component [Ketogulonicigenium vulgare]
MAEAVRRKKQDLADNGAAIAVLRLAFLGLLLLLWWLASENVSRNLIPSPLQTYDAFWRLIENGRLLTALGDSLQVFLGGYGLAILVAVPLGLVMGSLKLLGKTLEVYLYALAATPRVAFIPLIIVFLGLGLEAKITVVFMGAVMPIVMNTYTGVQQVDRELIEMARSVGAKRRRIYWRIVLPGSLPYLIAGLRIGATIGLINTVVAELYTSVRGLGGLLATYGNSFRMAEYFVVVLSLALIGVVVTEILRHIEIRLARWKQGG